MSETSSLILALVDFIPSIVFAIGAYFLVKLVHQQCERSCTYLMVAGSSLVFFAGFFKAIWKLLYVTNTADIGLLSEMQFALAAPGFLLMLIGVVWFSRGIKVASPPLLAMAAWKIPFLAVMVLCSLGTNGILTYISLRRHLRLAAVGFGVAFVCVLGMGGLASGEQTVIMQWIAESINSIGQIGFAVGCYLLYHQSIHKPSETA